ncbi:phosphopantetheine-binding protein [Prescottella equi]|uniref:phosphopantetheine-binding protein n=1 Tax=Rhodococcus hoagii TaxID=43767 RepID=UPI000A10891E|nr:phosphopantetheine-binding protein [Prescottella equi]NKS66557.1 isochorismatase [Prescottella equi]NKT04116.1 isochorismatase [Prescottella equi]ORJ99941.1 isochorismatase [Prescottella equi]
MSLDRDTILADTAQILEVDVAEIDPSVSLVDQGLDSVRLMALVERWRDSGADVDFVSLASEPDLEQWITLLEPR